MPLTVCTYRHCVLAHPLLCRCSVRCRYANLLLHPDSRVHLLRMCVCQQSVPFTPNSQQSPFHTPVCYTYNTYVPKCSCIPSHVHAHKRVQVGMPPCLPIFAPVLLRFASGSGTPSIAIHRSNLGSGP